MPPGQVAEARLSLYNAAASDVLVRIELQLPPGWKAEPVLPVWLPPGSSADVPVRLTPPFTAPPGLHRVAAVLRDPGLFLEQQVDFTVPVLSRPDAAAELEPSARRAPPGSPLWVGVRVINRGNVPLQLHPTVESPPGWPVEVPPSDIAVAPGETGQSGMWLRVPDFQPPGRYPLTLTLQAPDWPGAWRARADLEVPAVASLQAERPEPLSVRPPARAALRARLFNAGNVPLHLRSAVSLPGGWEVEGIPQEVELPPGAEAAVEGAVIVPAGTPPGAYALSLDWLGPEGQRQGRWVQPVTVLPTPAVSAEALHPTLPAEPGRPLALLAQVVNEGNVPLRLQPRVELPPGWVLLVPPPSEQLQPLQQEIVLMSVLPPAAARAGAATVRAWWTDEQLGVGAVASFPLTVPEAPRLQVDLLTSPGYTLSEPYRLRFSVRNAGNRPERVRLDVRENLGIPTHAVPGTLRLDPGQSAEVTVQADVPSDLSASAYHRVVLTAVSEQAPQVQASAAASVELVARTAPLQAAYRWLPLTATWDTRIGPVSRRQDFQVEGTAWLPAAPGDDRSLSLRLREAGSLAVYRAPRWSAALGRQTFALSPLTLFDRQADGLDVRGRLGGWEAVVQALQASGERQAGLRVGYGWDALHDLSVQLLAAPDRGWTVVSAAARAAPLPALRLEGEAGCTLPGSSPGCGPGALRAAFAYAGQAWSLSLRGEGREPGYEGTPGGSAAAEAAFGAGLAPSLGLAAALRESAALGADGRPRSAAREGEVQLMGRRGRAALGARYRRRLESDAASSTWRRTDELRLDVNAPAGGAAVAQQLTWTRVEGTAGESSRTVGYRLSAYVPASRGSFAPYVRLAVPVADGTASPVLAGGLRWQEQLRPLWRLALGVGWEAGPPSEALASAELSYALAGGPGLRLAAEGRRPAGGGWVWSVAATYAVPLALPLGRLPNVGSLEGRVLDAAGRPAAGTVVRVGTLSAAADAEGRFAFPALSPGTYYLTLRPPGPERLSLPPTPSRLEVRPGQRLYQEFRLLEPAGIVGQVTPEPARLPEVGAGPSTALAEPPLAPGGLIVEIEGPGGSASTAADEQGRFRFGRLLPGLYRIRVRPDRVPALYEVDPQEVSLQLAPGQEAEVAFVVRPVVRRVEVQEGGELQPEPSGP